MYISTGSNNSGSRPMDSVVAAVFAAPKEVLKRIYEILTNHLYDK